MRTRRFTLALASLALLAPALARAQLTVVSSEAHTATASAPATTTFVVDGDLGVATALLSANADAQLRVAAPQVYAPLDLGIVRFHDTNTVVDSITWHRASDAELGVTVRAHVRAQQEHRTLTLSWVGDGVVSVANVVLDARVQIAFTPSGGVHLVVVGDTLSVAPQLTGLSGMGEQAVPMNGQQLDERSIDVNPLASRHARGTAIAITGVDGTTAHARITAVDESAPTPAATHPDATSAHTTTLDEGHEHISAVSETVTLPPSADVSDARATRATGSMVDAQCTDGRYAEALPPASAAIQDLANAYAPASAATFIDGALARRYPFGRAQVSEGRRMQDCIAAFLGDASTVQAVVVMSLPTIVHECGHFVDLGRSALPTSTYAISPTLVLTASAGDTTARGGATFARSELLTDAYQSLRPPCSGTPTTSCDLYADLYLTGASGEQGFNMVLEEAVQYINSLATAYAFDDIDEASGERTSQRDGILTFLWYIERYLHLARTSHPSAYDHLLHGSTGQWRKAILTVWGRAWIFLNASVDDHDLGIGDSRILPLVSDPALLDEIQRLRAVECP